MQKTPVESKNEGPVGAGKENVAGTAHDTATVPVSASGVPLEIGGRDGPDPTRFGDWEKAGRCIDF